ncbi:MAG: nucleotide exchange factor GrpE [Deltaproteobacteria bacterium]|jgi:molecular chaperone GrpE|nr:nucleotide exchange factor GrpE [Deltaproteobacteria bacterium]MBT4014991.1 nucleotide exchange factor GrpE [Deltaproteobacteria bacterium]MBT4628989.1 nucleotide exchange factor GrpE [Deltaproteobacteria bacterium]MBT5086420.1 nucleotide exchange factor GrpE [Deltaproteobacteria bacterium]MBT5833257.1 nucleotide exchange factor GrpE [Deltaproteobacteria bacterium]
MSARNLKETAVKKKKTNKLKKEKANGNIEEVTATEISDTSADNKETASIEEDLLEKERIRAQNMEDRFLRVNAEFENYKKRMIRESSDRLKYFHLDLIKELLPSLDNLERAISHAKSENNDVDSMIEGLEMVNKMTHEVFEKYGVSRVDTTGEVFDPNFHQAVGVVESDSVPENHIVEECLGGYLLHDRIIRPAMVRVSGKN